jgi:RNA polymerase sporulation-specific sigma factor
MNSEGVLRLFGLLSFLAFLFHELATFTAYVTNNSFPKPLEQEEEEEYLKKMRQGDSRARRILIERNLRLVAHMIKKFENTDEDPEDLISIGTIGLIKAINTYNHKKGTRLATYAARCIENEILMALRKTNPKRQKEVYLQAPMGTDKEGNEISLIDILGSDPDMVLDEVERSLLQSRLYKVLKTLKKRERTVLTMRYGLPDGSRKTQKEVARHLGISRSYVSRIEKRAVQKISEEFQKREYPPVVE